MSENYEWSYEHEYAPKHYAIIECQIMNFVQATPDKHDHPGEPHDGELVIERILIDDEPYDVEEYKRAFNIDEDDLFDLWYDEVGVKSYEEGTQYVY